MLPSCNARKKMVMKNVWRSSRAKPKEMENKSSLRLNSSNKSHASSALSLWSCTRMNLLKYCCTYSPPTPQYSWKKMMWFLISPMKRKSISIPSLRSRMKKSLSVWMCLREIQSCMCQIQMHTRWRRRKIQILTWFISWYQPLKKRMMELHWPLADLTMIHIPSPAHSDTLQWLLSPKIRN